MERSTGHKELYWEIYNVLADHGYYISQRFEGLTSEELDAFILKVISLQGEPRINADK